MLYIVAKIDKLIKKIDALFASGQAKVIVKGTAAYTYAADTAGVKDVSIQVSQYSFDPAKCFVILNGGQPTDYTSNVSYIRLTDKELVVRIYVANSASYCSVSYQIVQLP